MSDFDFFVKTWLAELTDCPPEVVGRAWHAGGEAGGAGLVDALVRTGALSRIAARAAWMAHAGRYDPRDLRELVRPERLRYALVRLAETTVPGGVAPAESAPPPRLFRLGQRLGKYAVKGYLGGGASSQVYLSSHPALGVPVALKVFAPVPGGPAEFLAAQFRSESRVLAGLLHPNVVRIYDAEDDDPPFLVLEFVGGDSLQLILEHEERLSPPRAFRYAASVARALAAAARQGVTHLDVKPANVLTALDGTVKLADFGSARIRSDSAVVQGTPPYMAPEQYAGWPDARSDVYALGVMLYQTLGGRLPDAGTTTRRVLGGPVPAPLEPLRRAAPGVSAEVSELVGRMTALDPDDRPQTHDRVLAGLEAAFGMKLDDTY